MIFLTAGTILFCNISTNFLATGKKANPISLPIPPNESFKVSI